MDEAVRSWTLRELAQVTGSTVTGDSEKTVRKPVPAGSDDPEGITFVSDASYLKVALKSRVGAIIARTEVELGGRDGLVNGDPRVAFGIILHLSQRPLPLSKGIHPTSIIAETATVDPTANIGAFAVIESGARIGARAKVFAHCYVGEHCSVGDDAVLYPRVTLYQDVAIGERTVVHSGAVIGADGFGFVWDGHKRVKIPQVGGVRIGADCEVGANSCIDRATAGETTLEDGVKLDDLVMVGHNVTIGEHGAIASQSGISGSAKVGKRSVIGGQVGIGDHVEIADDVHLGGRTGVKQNIRESGGYLGVPPMPVPVALRTFALLPRLPELARRVRQLEIALEKDKE